MSERQTNQTPKPERDETVCPVLTNESLYQPQPDEQQTQYLAEYRLQLRRMSCPGCGEGDPIF